MFKKLASFALLALLLVYFYKGEGLNLPTSSDDSSVSVSDESYSSSSRSESPLPASGMLTPEPLLPAERDGLPEQILRKKAYVVSYNKETLQPNWVAWTLVGDNVKEENMIVERPSRAPFREDDEVPTPRATLGDYRGSGWTRGHNCPAGDCRWNEDVQYESFLLTNISPQDRALNAGVWNDIEKSCRRWARRYGKIYIVTGPIFFKKSTKGYIGPNNVKVPDAFFKVILDVNSRNPKGIGFVCRNENTKSDEATTTPSGKKRTKKEIYIHSISEVERITGYDFFPSLPDDIEQKVESTANYDEW